MASNLQKRKYSDEQEQLENKKVHSDLDFSLNEISAESTLVDNLDIADQVESIVDSTLLASDRSEDDESDTSLVKNIVNLCSTVIARDSDKEESVDFLREQLI